MLKIPIPVLAALSLAGCGAAAALAPPAPHPQDRHGAQQPACGPRAAIVGQLADHYGERQTALGVAGDGAAAVELWTAGGGESWSLLVTRRDGVSCLVAAGQDWTAVPAPHAQDRRGPKPEEQP